MELEEGILKRVRNWDRMSRWERSELGRDLRRQGMSYGEIMDLIPVKKSTLATWCRDVPLTELQIEALKERTGSVKGIPRDTQPKRREEIERIREVARAEVAWLSLDPNWVAGVVMYWAEGTKTRNKFSMANTDPRVLRLFIAWVRDYLLPDAEFRLMLHLHEGNIEANAQEHWRQAFGPSRGVVPEDFREACRYRTQEEQPPAWRVHRPDNEGGRRLAESDSVDR